MIDKILERIQLILELFFWSDHYHSTALESKCLVSASPGLLKSAEVKNQSATDLYLLLFDASAEPAGATVPLSSWKMPANTVGNFEFNQKYSIGMYMALSTTQFSYTDAAVDAAFNVEFKTMLK